MLNYIHSVHPSTFLMLQLKQQLKQVLLELILGDIASTQLHWTIS